jgi:hypothetical protein
MGYGVLRAQHLWGVRKTYREVAFFRPGKLPFHTQPCGSVTEGHLIILGSPPHPLRRSAQGRRASPGGPLRSGTAS